MFERFSDDARFVVTQARTQAQDLRHRYIGTEHLLLALLDERGGGGAARVLAAASVTADGIRTALTAVVSPLPGILSKADVAALESIGIDLGAVVARLEESFGPLAPVPRCGRGRFGRRRRFVPAAGPSFSPRSKKALELSLREAVRLGDDRIGPEHLLLGILREGGGLAVRILADSGVDLAELARRTESALRRAA